MTKSIALVEFEASHVECLYSQILFLKKSGYKVHLLIPEELRSEVAGFCEVDYVKYINRGRGFRGRVACVLDIRKYLINNGIRTALFNTAEGNFVRDFCIVAPYKMKLIGTIHHTNKLHKSFTQKIISLRIQKYFVLNDFLLAGIPKRRRYAVESYYPIFFPRSNASHVEKGPNETWVGIPGLVEFRRRDYRGLLEQLTRHKPDPKLKFILLGRCDSSRGDGAELHDIVREANLEAQFQIFQNFIPQEVYFDYIRQCDLLLPLIHPDTSLYDIYKLWQVSGTYNLSFGFFKPMLVHHAFEHIADFHHTCFFYEQNKMVDLINDLATVPELISSKVKAFGEIEKFSFDYQCRKYNSFLCQSKKED